MIAALSLPVEGPRDEPAQGRDNPMAMDGKDLRPGAEQAKAHIEAGVTGTPKACDSLKQSGFLNIYLLTGGLQGLLDHGPPPASWRVKPRLTTDSAKAKAWQAIFAVDPVSSKTTVQNPPGNSIRPRIIETEWLGSMLGAPGLKIIDLRPQTEYNGSHIPNSLNLNVESLRGNIGGIPSRLLPPPMLAAHFSLLGLQPSDTVVLVSGENLFDLTLAGMAFERLEHMDYAIMNGGYAKWALEKRPANAALPAVTESKFPFKNNADDFTVDFRFVDATLGRPGKVIIDVRPPDFFTGKQSSEARAGHIPGALNRPFTEDVIMGPNKVIKFKPLTVLAAAYGRLIPSKNSEVIVYCRGGRLASQTFFVLKRLLGYSNVRWYDAGWTDWAARLDLPAEKETLDLGKGN